MSHLLPAIIWQPGSERGADQPKSGRAEYTFETLVSRQRISAEIHARGGARGEQLQTVLWQVSWLDLDRPAGRNIIQRVRADFGHSENNFEKAIQRAQRAAGREIRRMLAEASEYESSEEAV
jgi:hypothetical protein